MTTAEHDFYINVKSLNVACFPNMIVNATMNVRLPFVTSKCAPPTAVSFMQFIYIKQDEQGEAWNRHSLGKFTINTLLITFLKTPK